MAMFFDSFKLSFIDTEPCGAQCELLTKCDQVAPCRASWAVKTHPAQEQLVSIESHEGDGCPVKF